MNGTMELECNYNRGDLNALADAVMGGIMVLEYAPDRQYEVRYISDGLYDLLEMEPGNMGESEMEPIDWEDCIHPEDFGKIRESLDNAVHNLCDFNVEFRVRSKEKGYKWLSANVVVRKCEEEYSYYITAWIFQSGCSADRLLRHLESGRRRWRIPSADMRTCLEKR